MVALGVAALWAGYYLAMYGYCLIRGYNVTFTSLMHTTWPQGSTLGKDTYAAAAGAV